MQDIQTIDAVITWHGETQKENVTFGVLPDWFDQDVHDFTELGGLDAFVFYWLDPSEAKNFGAGFDNGDWVVVS